MEGITASLHGFYCRWHLLEESLGAKGGSVLDFDLAPRGPWRGLPPFKDRLVALRELMELQGRCEGQPFHNTQAVQAKLRGAEVYLRLLLGERMPFEETFEAMMGLAPSYIPKSDLEEDRARVEETLGVMGLTLERSAEAGGIGQAFHREDMSTFEADLRGEADLWLKRIEERVGLGAEPEGDGLGSQRSDEPGETIQGFKLVVVKKDAYWSNWIDGNWENGILLQVNIHPRIRYTQTSHIGLAAHEIGGHALHVMTLIEEARAGRLDEVLLNLTVHSMEAFHMEGLAQGVCGLIGRKDEVHPGARLREQLSRYHMGLLNNAHLDLEAGAHPGTVIDKLLRASPFLRRHSAIPSLQDRRSNPLLRSYQFVYGPARRLFEGAAALPDAQRFAFMGEMYRSIQTPSQIAARLDALAREAQQERVREAITAGDGAKPEVSTRERLEARHGVIAQGVRQLQRLVVQGEGAGAASLLAQLLGDLEAHMLAEERHLFPAYGRGVPKPGRGAAREVFEAEHRKLRSLGGEALKALASYGGARLSPEDSLVILEVLHPFKQLLHHHEMREEALLGPAMDDALGLEERRGIYDELEEAGW